MAALGEMRAAERGFAKVQQDSVSGPSGAAEADITAVHARLLATFKSGRTKSYEWRVKQLSGLRRLLTENADRIFAAVSEDLGRPKMEALIGDVGPKVSEIDHALKHLKSWMAPQKVPTPVLSQPAHSSVVREPKGLVLVIAPWNFPVGLSVGGILAALSAGNCCVLKPSEVSGSSEKILSELIPQYMDPDAIAVVTGGVPETTTLLKLRWDHILYTGNSVVARIVSKAAAEHLTPVTLELGGKSPTVVLPSANLSVAAKRILSGKCTNAGQICIAPDYALVHESMEAPLVAELQKTLKEWFGADASKSPSFGRIINDNHFGRVSRLLETSGGEVLPQLGTMDKASKFIPPTLIRGPRIDSPVMQEEIFGPLLPIIKKGTTDELIAHINENEKPLAMYVFGSEKEANEIISRTSSGGVCVNDVIFHYMNPELPFGGVGNSGMGKYHGKWGFDEFSHARAVMYRSTWIDPAMRYPPYTEGNQKMFERIMIGPMLSSGAKAVLAGVGAVACLAGAKSCFAGVKVMSRL
jgi:aldehyde dehydrogenase (NAD+)